LADSGQDIFREQVLHVEGRRVADELDVFLSVSAAIGQQNTEGPIRHVFAPGSSLQKRGAMRKPGKSRRRVGSRGSMFSTFTSVP